MSPKIIIVEPRSSRANVFSFFSYLPLMGPLYLGTILKENGFDVKILNENVLKRDILPEDLDADFLLLSCLTPTVTRGYEIARMYRAVQSNGKIAIGGPHVTFMKEEAAEFADYVVEGEGENIIADLVKYGSDEKFVKGTKVADLDSLPFVDWRLLAGSGRGGTMPVMTSRGCPFACNFCSVAEMYGRKYRAMSPERVLEEVRRSHKKDIFFYDDNFTADRARAHAIMDGMIRLGVKPRTWSAQVRSDVSRDNDLVKKMARSGCNRVYIGFESINPETLKGFKKSQTPDDISHAIETLHGNGISVHGMFIFGADSDDPAVVAMTREFVRKNRIDSVQFLVLTPFPGTELFRKMESDGRLIHTNWEHYDAQHVVFWPEKFSPFALQRLAIESFKNFYTFANAGNEILNVAADKLANCLGQAYSRGRSHTYSIKNALLKAGGKFIVGRWQRINRSYMAYLHQLGGQG